MFGRHAKAVVLVAALLVLAVEGVLLVRYYDRYYGPDDASGAPFGSAPALDEGTMPEGTMPQGTVPEGTALEKTTATGDVPSKESATAFLHRATDENSRGDYTYLSDPAVDGNPNAVVLVVASEDAGGTDYEHNVGVWYEFADQKKWAIFNQDLAAVPTGASFRVVIPPESERLVHRAKPANTVGGTTYLDRPLTNGEPGIVLLVTQNWNPGGGAGVYNDHPVGVLYDEDAQRWAVYNRDGAPIPDGAAFNVAVSESEQGAR